MLKHFNIKQSTEEEEKFIIVGFYEGVTDDGDAATAHLMAYREECGSWFDTHGDMLTSEEQLFVDMVDDGAMVGLAITFWDRDKAMLFKLSFVNTPPATLAFAA